MVLELRAYDVVVLLSVGKSQNYQKLRINYVTATSCVSWADAVWGLFLLFNFSVQLSYDRLSFVSEITFFLDNG